MKLNLIFFDFVAASLLNSSAFSFFNCSSLKKYRWRKNIDHSTVVDISKSTLPLGNVLFDFHAELFVKIL